MIVRRTTCEFIDQHRFPKPKWRRSERHILYAINAIAVCGELKPTYHSYKKCVFVVFHFDSGFLDKGLIKDTGQNWMFIPLIKQKVGAFRRAGIQQVLDAHNPVCDYFARVLLENIQLSPFAQRYETQLRKQYDARQIYNKLADGRFCAVTNTITGKFRWLTYVRQHITRS